MTPGRHRHVERVVALLDDWAGALGVPAHEANRWRKAGWLHDALKDASPGELAPVLDPEFQDAPSSLWHGPAAASRAASDGESDRGVLAAVRYHTVGFARWDAVGRMLFLADYLEPGRPEGATDRAHWRQRVAEGPEGVADALMAVLTDRIAAIRKAGGAVHPCTEDWWNAIAP